MKTFDRRSSVTRSAPATSEMAPEGLVRPAVATSRPGWLWTVLCHAVLVVLLLFRISGVAAAADSEAAIKLTQNPRVEPTIHSIGIEWDVVSGDEHHDGRCNLRYRVKGASQWTTASPLLRVDYDGWYERCCIDVQGLKDAWGCNPDGSVQPIAGNVNCNVCPNSANDCTQCRQELCSLWQSSACQPPIKIDTVTNVHNCQLAASVDADSVHAQVPDRELARCAFLADCATRIDFTKEGALLNHKHANMFSGSLMFLDSGTAYEIELSVDDPVNSGATNPVALPSLVVAGQPCQCSATACDCAIETLAEPHLTAPSATFHVRPGPACGCSAEACDCTKCPDGKTKKTAFPDLRTAELCASHAKGELGAQGGDRFLLHGDGGPYPGGELTKPGTPNSYIAWQKVDGEATFTSPLYVRASHVWIEGLTFAPKESNRRCIEAAAHEKACVADADCGVGRCASLGIVLDAASKLEDIAIVRNTFRDCKDYSIVAVNPSGAKGNCLGDGKTCTSDAECGASGSCQMFKFERHLYIADNVISNHPIPPDNGFGISLFEVADSDICYNRISSVPGTQGDALELHGENLDIYGNDIRDIPDDAIQGDYSNANIRIWKNRMVGSASFMSFQPMLGAPWYIVRNEYISHNVAPSAPGDAGVLLKFNVLDRFVLVNNTMVARDAKYAQASADALFRSFSRNNLWVQLYKNDGNVGGAIWYIREDPGDGKYMIHGQPFADWKTDLAYDGFDWDTLPDLSKDPSLTGVFWWGPIPGEQNTGDGQSVTNLEALGKKAGNCDSPSSDWCKCTDGSKACSKDSECSPPATCKRVEHDAIRVDKKDLFALTDMKKAGASKEMQEAFAAQAINTYAAQPFSPRRLSLNPKSSAIDAGQKVPNLSGDLGVDFEHPDLGAYESGTPPTHYGPRHVLQKPPRPHSGPCHGWILVGIDRACPAKRSALPSPHFFVNGQEFKYCCAGLPKPFAAGNH